jgi:hypothetical protein
MEPVCCDVLNDEEGIARLLAFFSEVICAEGWQAGQELTAYGERTVWLALRRGDEIIGGAQLIRGPGLLPCLTVWPELDLVSRADCVDVALIALRQDVRGNLEYLWTLMVAIWRWCMANGIHELWAEVPPQKLRAYTRTGFPWKIHGELRLHWAEGCYPCRTTVQATAREVARRAERSAFFRELLDAELRAEPIRLPELLAEDAA